MNADRMDELTCPRGGFHVPVDTDWVQTWFDHVGAGYKGLARCRRCHQQIRTNSVVTAGQIPWWITVQLTIREEDW